MRVQLDNLSLGGYICIVTQMSKEPPNSAVHGRGCCPAIDELLEARFFKALCDPSRIGILARLAQSCEPRTVSDIASCCLTNVSVVSRHLAMLRDVGILHAEKRGKEVYYAVRYPELAATLRRIADAIEACCPD